MGSSPRDALYRAAISCAGLLFLVRTLVCLLLSILRDERERDIDHVLSSSSSSSIPCRGSVLKTIP